MPPVEWLAGRTYQDRKPLPALASSSWQLDEQHQAVLLALYGEVCGGWRTLTDVRFKLPGLLPIVSVAVRAVYALSTLGWVLAALQPWAPTLRALLGP